MNLTDAISEALMEDAYFGLPKQTTTYKAVKTKAVSGITGVTHVGVIVLKLNSTGVATPHSFTIEDILNTDWLLKASVNEVDNDAARHSGIVVVAPSELEAVIQILENEGYGSVDSYQNDTACNTCTIFCKSHLFNKVESGSPTPKYTLTYEEDTGTLSAELYNV